MRSLVKIVIAVILAFCAAKITTLVLNKPDDTSALAAATHRVKDVPLHKGYPFEVKQAGDVMRFSLRGHMPDNAWKSVSVTMVDPNGNYLFTWLDELWTQSGYNDGYWTESRSEASFVQRFSKVGTYTAFIAYEEGPQRQDKDKRKPTEFSLNIVKVRGDVSVLNTIMSVFAYLIVFSIMLFFIMLWLNGDSKKTQSTVAKVNAWPVFTLALILLLLIVLAGYAMSQVQDDDDVDWEYESHRKSYLYHDKSLKGKSVSGESFRGGSGRGGK